MSNSNSSIITNISISSDELIIDNDITTIDNNYISFTNPLFNKGKLYNNYVLSDS